ncbi:MAG: CheR family methyltransferase [Bacteroidia bacterium]|jgi:two-component system CheB/CheR fusion protein
MLKKASGGGEKTRAVFKKESGLFPIVAIGASAGGLEAVIQLMKHIPEDTGMAFFYIQHLSPDHVSSLPVLLAKSLKLKVLEVKNGLTVKRNCLYVCVPNKEMSVIEGKIKLVLRNDKKLPYLPIDAFFSSLAKNYKGDVIGVVLSGNASDGTQGLRAIKKAGGLTFAQDNSAKNNSMPVSAIEEGVVDFVLSPLEISRKLIRFSQNNFEKETIMSDIKHTGIIDNAPDLKIIFEILNKETGVDFGHYKLPTIKRRLNYRMLHCGAKSLKQYIKRLLEDKKEVTLLYKDLLINVTSFFRDKETFRYLKSRFLPKLIKSKADGQSLRIWVAACSTGEEAYSIAMLVAELQDENQLKVPVQIFATDLSDQAIRDARIGEYSQNEIDSITSDRLKRFFKKAGNCYRVAKRIREMCVFASHNILRDPPFSRMDFISCRNLLIYFDTAAQKRILATLSFGLGDKGYLMLGKSESIGTTSQFFTTVNSKFKIYSRKKSTGARKIPELSPYYMKAPAVGIQTKIIDKKKTVIVSKELDDVIDTVLLSQYTPACVVINKDMEILKFRGATSFYLSHSSGNASLNILKMADPELTFELRSAINKAFKTKQMVRRPDVELKGGPIPKVIAIEVYPLKIDWNEPLLLIVFIAQDKIEQASDRQGAMVQTNRRIKKLKEELQTTRAEMQAVLEAQEAAYEKLQRANEEVVSTNEEFQTLNEELETSKEEIEAANEELTSTNQELQMRNELLNESYLYSEAIIATIHEPMLILDNNLVVKSANESFYKKFLLNKDETEGVSLFELNNQQWNVPKLRELLNGILSHNRDFKNIEITNKFSGVNEKTMLFNAHRIIQKTHRKQLILLAIEDITERTLHFMREKELLHKDIKVYKSDKEELEKAVKRRTKQLDRKNKELESVNKDLTSFTYVSSHDLQEPLRKIKNFVTVLLDEEKKNLSEDGKKYLQQTYDTAKRMQALIEDLLAYSRAKNIERKFENTDLNLLLKEVESDFEEVLLQKKGKIKVGKLCEVSIIPFQFRQLFFNLIGNSLKFSQKDKAPLIKISSEIVLAGKLNKEKLLPNVHYCHITLSDNGIGFDNAYKDKIFEVFQRLHTHDKFDGTGMGLAICKRIVENHNGVIIASGEVNKGAAFDIYIPLIQTQLQGSNI